MNKLLSRLFIWKIYKLKDNPYSWCAYEYIIVKKEKHNRVYYKTKSNPHPFVFVYTNYYEVRKDVFNEIIKDKYILIN